MQFSPPMPLPSSEALASRCLLLPLIAATAACQVHDARRAPHVWTLPDLDQALQTGAPVASGETFAGGLPATTFLEPNEDGTCRPRVLPAFAEAQPAAYVVSDLWSHYDAVWAQPWYSLVTAWDEKNPSQNRLKGADGKSAPAIYDVDTDSTFYSPFWKVIWVVVPPDTTTERYTSSRAILDAKLPLHDGPPWIYAMRTDRVNVGQSKMTHPALGSEVGSVSIGPNAWFEGVQKPSLNLGGNNFLMDEGLIVEEAALYWFVRRGAANETAVELPGIVGTGPAFTRRPAEIVGNRPRFGGLCRLHLALLPPTAAAFDPDADPAVTQKLVDANLDPNAFRGRVAMNAAKGASTDVACFADASFPTSCVWLDSQAAVEDRLGESNIVRTEITLTCPFVSWAGKAVK